MTRIVRDFEQLPPRIKTVVLAAGARVDEFVLAMKSSYKPNATIPIIWFVVTKDRLLLCNTHKTRGLWRTLAGAAVGSLQLHHSSLAAPYFVLSDADGSVYVTVPDGTSADDLDVLVQEFGRLRGR